MVIVCGTDFTGASSEAARAAAAIAARIGVPLWLVHVLDFPMAPEQGDSKAVLGRRWLELFQPEMERRQKLLENEADRLTESGAEVEVRVLSGAPDEALIACALEASAQLIVVASLGRRSASAWRLGSVADRLALTSPLPVLVARDARPFETWSDGRDGGKPLKVLFGADWGSSSEAAATWVGELKTAGPCELVGAHVYEPGTEARRLGLTLPEGPGAAQGQLERALSEVWHDRLAERAGDMRLVLRPRSSGGHVADQLVDLAEAEWADLIVVGSHQRKGFSRHWHGSVSYSVLPLAATNVVVVPVLRKEEAEPGEIPRITRVLAVTDLSDQGNRAVTHAFALVPRGGQVTLMHVLLPPVPVATPYGGYIPVTEDAPAERSREQREIEEALRALTPPSARETGVEVKIEVMRASDVAEAACQLAERLSADIVCMATHAHGAVATALLGSAAQGVVRRCGRPVLLIGPTREE